MSSPNYGRGRDNTASVVSLYRHILKGKYLDRFNEQADSLNYYGAMTLGGELHEMQQYGPGDEAEDCDCGQPAHATVNIEGVAHHPCYNHMELGQPRNLTNGVRWFPEGTSCPACAQVARNVYTEEF